MAKQRKKKLMIINQLIRSRSLLKALRMILLRVKILSMFSLRLRGCEKRRIWLRSRIRLYQSKRMNQGKLEFQGQ